jgi:predicted TIM-barrel fold metal-dependent hydrolase
LLRGIRHSVSRDVHFPEGIVIRPAPAGLLGDHAYRRGLATLARQGLTYDAMLYHSQLPELVSMARALPDLSIVLDHIGCIPAWAPMPDAPSKPSAPGRPTWPRWPGAPTSA